MSETGIQMICPEHVRKCKCDNGSIEKSIEDGNAKCAQCLSGGELAPELVDKVVDKRLENAVIPS